LPRFKRRDGKEYDEQRDNSDDGKAYRKAVGLRLTVARRLKEDEEEAKPKPPEKKKGNFLDI
jgi:hypothetical protein